MELIHIKCLAQHVCVGCCGDGDGVLQSVSSLSSRWVCSVCDLYSPCLLCFQALLSAHDTVAQKDFEPLLPPLPDNIPESEEAMRIVCLVKNQQPLVRKSLYLLS